MAKREHPHKCLKCNRLCTIHSISSGYPMYHTSWKSDCCEADIKCLTVLAEATEIITKLGL